MTLHAPVLPLYININPVRLGLRRESANALQMDMPPALRCHDRPLSCRLRCSSQMNYEGCETADVERGGRRVRQTALLDGKVNKFTVLRRLVSNKMWIRSVKLTFERAYDVTWMKRRQQWRWN